MYTAFKNPIFPNWIELVKKTKKVYPKKKRKQRVGEREGERREREKEKEREVTEARTRE